MVHPEKPKILNCGTVATFTKEVSLLYLCGEQISRTISPIFAFQERKAYLYYLNITIILRVRPKSVIVLEVEMWVVSDNGNYSAMVLSILRGNVGLMGKLYTQLKI